MSGFFHGRAAELARLGALARDPVAVIYGLPGIGKTELAFHALDAVHATPAWRDVPITRVVVDPANHPDLHGFVLARLTGEGSARALDRLVDVLERGRHLLMIEDAQHAEAEVAALVDALARRSGASRVVVTSRVELPLETTPIVVRLGPLDAAEAHALAVHLAQRLGVNIASVDALVARSAGSPLVLRHLVAGGWAAAGLDPVQATVESLDPETRRCLTRLASVSGCAQSRLAVSTLVSDDRVLQTLRERCLVDCGPERIVVHGLVRDLVMTQADAELVRDSRRAVAGALWAGFEQHQRPLCAVEAICLTASLGDLEQALGRMIAAARTIASAGLEPLLLPVLERIAAAGLDDAVLFVARIYLRMGRITDAARLVERLTATADPAAVLAIRASIAAGACDLAAATADLGGAIALAPPGRWRGLLQQRLAIVHALGGREREAQAELAEGARANVAPSPVDAARLWGTRAFVAAAQLRWGEVVTAAGRGRAAAGEATGARDLDYLLLLLELVAVSEQGNVARARELADEVAHRRSTQPARERMTDLVLGIARLACGQLDLAAELLERAQVELGRTHDTLLALLAGYYLGVALLTRGDARAAAVLDTVARRAGELGLAPLLACAQVRRARALVATGQLAVAARLAEPMTPHPLPQVASEAGAVLAAVAAYGGDLGRAREHLAAALDRAGELEPLRSELILDEAELEMLGGDPEHVRIAALAILRDDARRARPFARGRALIALATADLATGAIDTALEALAEAEELAAVHGLPQLRERATLIRGATAHARASSFDHVLAAHRPGYLGLLRLLGLRIDSMLVVTRRGVLHVEPSQLGEVARRHDVLIEVGSGTLIGRSGQRVEGRGTGSAILVALADSAEPLPPERLYQLVWGGAEYHPLRHRNTLYIALNRTRKLLRDVGEEREVIHRDPAGWSIAPDIDLAIARRDPRVASTSRGLVAAVKTK